MPIEQKATLTITITVLSPLAVVAPPGPYLGEVGVPFGPYQFSASGGRPPYVWEAAQLPPGLTMTPDGVLSGVPSAGGDWSVSVTVRNTEA